MSTNISVSIGTLSGESVKFDIDPQCSILEVKRMAAAGLNLPTICQKLVFNNLEEGLPYEVAEKKLMEWASRYIENALLSIEVLDNKHFAELKCMLKPPEAVELVVKAVMHMQARLDPMIEIDRKGRVKDLSWRGAQRMMSHPRRFLANLKDFKGFVDEGLVPQQNIEAAKKIRDQWFYLFDPEDLKRVADVASGLCGWLINMLSYIDLVGHMQNLTNGTDVWNWGLDDCIVLADCCKSGAVAVSLSAVATDNMMKAGLVASEPSIRCDAVQGLAWYWKLDAEFAINAMVERCLVEPSFEVRAAAKSALCEVCDKEDIVTRLSPFLKNSKSSVMQAALETLLCVIGNGDDRCVSLVVDCLEECSGLHVEPLANALGYLSDSAVARVTQAMRAQLRKSPGWGRLKSTLCAVATISNNNNKLASEILAGYVDEVCARCDIKDLEPYERTMELLTQTALQEDTVLRTAKMKLLVFLLETKVTPKAFRFMGAAHFLLDPRVSRAAHLLVESLRKSDMLLVTSHLLPYLTHSDPKVRGFAVDALLKSVQEDGESAIAPSDLFEYFTHADPRVRGFAVDVLLELVKKDEECAIAPSRLFQYFTHTDPRVRRFAFDVLLKLVEKDNERATTPMVTSRIVQCFTHSSPSVRSFACRSLLKLVHKDDEQAITSIAVSLEEVYEWARQTAVKALAKIGSVGNAQIIALLIERIEKDLNAGVVQEAVRALAHCSEKGNAPAIAITVGCLAHQSAWVRKTAAEALCQLSNKGDDSVISQLCLCLCDDDAEVVNAAILTLSQISLGLDTKLISALAALLYHRDPWVGRAAAECLGIIAEAGDEQTLAALKSFVECAEHKPLMTSEDVAQVAKATISSLTRGTEAK